MLFITLMTKCLIQRKRSTKYDKDSPKLKQGATGTSRRSSPSRRPCGALLQLRRVFIVFLYFAPAVSDIFVINVINNIRISIYYVLFVICAVIHCSFCSIYVCLDPGTYMIARFMFFYKPGVTVTHPLSLWGHEHS